MYKGHLYSIYNMAIIQSSLTPALSSFRGAIKIMFPKNLFLKFVVVVVGGGAKSCERLTGNLDSNILFYNKLFLIATMLCD